MTKFFHDSVALLDVANIFTGCKITEAHINLHVCYLKKGEKKRNGVMYFGRVSDAKAWVECERKRERESEKR